MKVGGYNLQEILVVLLIIGILMLIALPNMMPYIAKTKSIEAQVQLKHIHNAQSMHRYMYSRFSADLTEIDYEAPKTVLEGGNAFYKYEIIESSNSTFKARAEAVEDFDGDGVFNVWEIDESGVPKQIIKD